MLQPFNFLDGALKTTFELNAKNLRRPMDMMPSHHKTRMSNSTFLSSLDGIVKKRIEESFMLQTPMMEPTQTLSWTSQMTDSTPRSSMMEPTQTLSWTSQRTDSTSGSTMREPTQRGTLRTNQTATKPPTWPQTPLPPTSKLPPTPEFTINH